MSNPFEPGIFPASMWIAVWDRAYYSISVGEIEQELAHLDDNPPDWDKWKKPYLLGVLDEHKTLLNEARQELKPYMRRKMVRGAPIEKLRPTC